MLIRKASGETHFLDYREKAPPQPPSTCTRTGRKVIPGLSTRVHPASGVPGTVAGLVYALATSAS